MKKKLGLFFLLLLMFEPLAFAKEKAYCAKRCFNTCKSSNQSVSGCDIINVTSISFDVKCHCRALKKDEKLPDSPTDYLINTRSFSH